MDFSKNIAEFVSEQVGGIYITDIQDHRIVYADAFLKCVFGAGDVIIGKIAEEVFPWVDSCPLNDELADGRYEWEYMDIKSKKYWKINSGLFMQGQQPYRIEQVIDVTDYMSLSSEITKYMSFFKKLSAFQSEIFMRLSDNYSTLLPLISDFMKVPRIYLLLQRDEYVEIVTYCGKEKNYSTLREPMCWIVKKLLEEQEGAQINASEIPSILQKASANTGAGEHSVYICLCSGNISGQAYAIYVEPDVRTLYENMHEEMIINVIRLYLENGIMRENIIYAGEHDAMTGLYNKGKYIDRVEHEYRDMDSIGIFNFDVNNLKTMNDTYGHEAGDRLLIKAADSILAVVDSNCHGYRLGGDEYMLILCNPKKEDMDTVKDRWEEALRKLNEEEDGIDCVVAVGTAYGEKGYKFEQLMQIADTNMYEDKKRKKKPGEVIR